MKNQNISHFRDIHVHAATVQEWNQDYNQLTAGTAESSLIQLTTGRCHVFREQINQRVVQHGVAPRGKMCFAVPITVPGSIRMQGREVDESSLFFLHGGEEFMFHMPMGMELLAITFERELFEQALAQTASAKEISQLLRQPVIRLPRNATLTLDVECWLHSPRRSRTKNSTMGRTGSWHLNRPCSTSCCNS